MKRFFLIIFILASIITIKCSAQNKNYVSIPRADGSPLSFEISHLWTGLKNHIMIPATDSLIKIWSNNGIIDEINDKINDDYIITITPQKNGVVKIYTTSIRTNNKFDTINNISVFTSIPPTRIKIDLDEKKLKEQSILIYNIIFEEKLKEKERYQLGAFPYGISVFIDEKEIGIITPFTPIEEEKELLQQGNRIIFHSLVFRDMQTDLLLYTDSIHLKYR